MPAAAQNGRGARRLGAAVMPFCVAGAEVNPVCSCMTTQQKTGAIQDILKNHEDNVAAMRAANVGLGLEALVIEAINTALKDDLAVVFATKSARAGRT
jgi:hypothetical protein